MNISTKTEITGTTSTMWRYIPIDEKSFKPHKEYEISRKKYSGTELIAASVRGKKHKHEGTNRDDWFETAHIGDWTFITVADGAGSKKLSRIGARLACTAAIDYIKEAFLEFASYENEIAVSLSKPNDSEEFLSTCEGLVNIIQTSVVKGYEAVRVCYEKNKDNEEFLEYNGKDLDIRDFSSTFITSVIIPVFSADEGEKANENINENVKKKGDKKVSEKKEILIINCHIGDGLVTAIDSKSEYEKSVKIIGNTINKDNKSYAGETEFLTDTSLHTAAELSKRTKIYRGSADTVMFMTDGVSDDYFPYEEGMTMLWLDLAANGIIPVKKAMQRGVSKIVSKIPRPISYPWVNDNNIRFSFQSAKKICDSTGILPKELWENRGLLTVKFPFVTVMEIESKEERLKFFIDNYTVRGSFDDRTLLIYLQN
ncbi:MAG: protein phosphatase 2C domain-containing protein [Ruminococcus sp.]|jgi:hypothetical protein|nr:protein phosphatase 2C domain-containing protein [Ruminococcus sp.]